MTKQSLTTEIIHSAETARHAVADGIANGLDTVRAEAVDLRDMATHGAAEAAHAVSKGIESAGREADIIVDAGKQQAAALQKLVAEELRTHPLRALGIAAVIGLAAGYLSSR